MWFITMDETMIIIQKELAKEFEGELNFLGENTEKCKTFSASFN